MGFLVALCHPEHIFASGWHLVLGSIISPSALIYYVSVLQYTFIVLKMFIVDISVSIVTDLLSQTQIHKEM